MGSDKPTHSSNSNEAARPHIGIIFKCCRVYARIYLNKKGDAFVGWCPRCAGKLEVKVSPTGSKQKFFTAE
ncbi:MAG: hypothetical protein AB1690_13250 [Candidatus Zixiibacteriota bacterium]